MAFVNFFVQTTGSNLNSGSYDGTTSAPNMADAATFTYAGGTFVAATGVFTVASGNPQSDGVAAGQFASIYTTSGATVATFVARVLSCDTTTITVTVATDTYLGDPASVSATAGAATLKIGGAWAGPNGAVNFPIGFMSGAVVDPNGGVLARLNIKGTYSVTATLVQNKKWITFQGYTTTPGDGGKAIIDGGESGAAYKLWENDVNSGNNQYIDLWFRHNGATGGSGSTPGVLNSSNRVFWSRCMFSGFRASGYQGATVSTMTECEAFDCNRSNANQLAGFFVGSSGTILIRCYSHHQTSGTNGTGFWCDTSMVLINCIAANNSGNGVWTGSDQYFSMIGCDMYNNGGDGYKSNVSYPPPIYAPIATSSVLSLNFQNCNFVKNGGYGINSLSLIRHGHILNCGFGSGTQANGGAQNGGKYPSGFAPIIMSGEVVYPADTTPWQDPANGDFRIVRAEGQEAGRGAFTQLSGLDSAPNTVGYPDIGAAPAKSPTDAEIAQACWQYSDRRLS